MRGGAQEHSDRSLLPSGPEIRVYSSFFADAAEMCVSSIPSVSCNVVNDHVVRLNERGGFQHGRTSRCAHTKNARCQIIKNMPEIQQYFSREKIFVLQCNDSCIIIKREM